MLHNCEIGINRSIGEINADRPRFINGNVSQDSIASVPHDNSHGQWVSAGQVSDLLHVAIADIAEHMVAGWRWERADEWTVRDGVEGVYKQRHHITCRHKRRSLCCQKAGCSGFGRNSS